MFAKLPSAIQLARMLQAYPAGPQRAQGALQFLCGASGADDGYLFVADPTGEPRLAASQGEQSAPAGLEADLLIYWSRLVDQSDDSFETLDLEQVRALKASAPEPTWQAPGGELYQRLALHGQSDRNAGLVGVAVLRLSGDSPVRFRHDLLGAVGQALVSEGAPAND